MSASAILKAIVARIDAYHNDTGQRPRILPVTEREWYVLRSEFEVLLRYRYENGTLGKIPIMSVHGVTLAMVPNAWFADYGETP